METSCLSHFNGYGFWNTEFERNVRASQTSERTGQKRNMLCAYSVEEFGLFDDGMPVVKIRNGTGLYEPEFFSCTCLSAFLLSCKNGLWLIWCCV